MDNNTRVLARLSLEMVLPHVYIEGTYLVFWSQKETRYLYVKPQAKILKLWEKGLYCKCCLEQVDHFLLTRTQKGSQSCVLHPVIRDQFDQPYPLTIDHIRPVSRGGTDGLKNLQLLCRRCNQIKSDQILTMEKLQAQVAKTCVSLFRSRLPQMEDVGIQLPIVSAKDDAVFPSSLEALVK